MFVAFILTCCLHFYIVCSIHTNVATGCLKDVRANVRGSKVLSKLVHKSTSWSLDGLDHTLALNTNLCTYFMLVQAYRRLSDVGSLISKNT